MKSVRLAGILIIALFIMLCYSSCNYKAGEVKPDTSKDSSLVSSGDPLLSCDDGIPAMRNSWNAGPALKVVEKFEKSLAKYPQIKPGTPDPYTPSPVKTK